MVANGKELNMRIRKIPGAGIKILAPGIFFFTPADPATLISLSAETVGQIPRPLIRPQNIRQAFDILP